MQANTATQCTATQYANANGTCIQINVPANADIISNVKLFDLLAAAVSNVLQQYTHDDEEYSIYILDDEGNAIY